MCLHFHIKDAEVSASPPSLPIIDGFPFHLFPQSQHQQGSLLRHAGYQETPHRQQEVMSVSLPYVRPCDIINVGLCHGG